jgi:CubicO group peptidase (beta-lactamase class C family)
MSRRKIFIRLFLLLLLVCTGLAIAYAWRTFAGISGYGAKNLCSAVYIQKRDPQAVIKEEFSEFPLSLGRFTLDEKDSSVTATVWGFARRKAIYRQGLGATLVNGLDEVSLRAQQFNLPVPIAINSDSISWPQGNKLPDTLSVTVDRQKLDQIMEEAFRELKAGKPVHTRALLVVYDGQLVAEKYAPGYDQHTPMLGWSVSKSLTAALVGILVKQGLLDINDPAPVPEWKGSPKENITIKQLLQQTSGLAFREIYDRPSEVVEMLFSQGDMAAYAAGRPLKHEPGTVFNYCGGNSNILGRMIRDIVGEKEYAAFPYRALFHKIGMNSLLLEPDAAGVYIASSYSYATARDFARFGLLYYNNGNWNGEQILPEQWIQESIQPATADPRKHYGYQFWLNGFAEGDTLRRWYPGVPADMYFADGYGGQDIYIIPSKKLVVVRLGLYKIDENKLLQSIIGTIP